MRGLVVLALVASCKDAPTKPARVAPDAALAVAVPTPMPPAKPDDGLAEKPDETYVAWLDRLRSELDTLAKVLEDELDCSHAAAAVQTAAHEAGELVSGMHELARASAEGYLVRYAPRLETAFARLQRSTRRCAAHPGFAAALLVYPFDPGRRASPKPKPPVATSANDPPANAPTGDRPAGVTQELLALTDQVMVMLDRLATGLAAMNSDCARGTGFLKTLAADPAIGKLSKRFQELTKDPAVMSWLQANRMTKVMDSITKMQPILTRCMSDPAFEAALKSLAQ